MKISIISAVFSGILLLGAESQADVLLNDNYSVYASGNLVGQNGWAQSGSSATSPVQITNGQLVIPPLPVSGGDNQDAIKQFSAGVTEPTDGSTATLFYGFNITVSSAPALPSYFAGVYDGTFTDGRIAAISDGTGGFQFEARVNGQAGYPFVKGISLVLGTQYTLIAQLSLVSGLQNDTLKLFINPTSSDLSSQTPYLTSSYTTGTATDPTTAISALLYSQFTNATSGQTGLTIGQAMASTTFAEGYNLLAVPEPTSLALLGFCAAGAMLRRGRRSSRVS